VFETPFNMTVQTRGLHIAGDVECGGVCGGGVFEIPFNMTVQTQGLHIAGDVECGDVCGGGVFEIPFNMTVQTRGLLEVDSEKLSSKSLLLRHSANHSRMLHCTDKVQFSSLLIIVC